MDKKLPIGYYLKKADNLLTEGINKVHSELGLTRTDWQILNSVNENENADRQKVFEILSEFADAETIYNRISGLIAAGFIIENRNLALTAKGKDVFKISLEKQKIFRQRSMQNISEEEYSQLINTLEKIINNLS